MFLKPWDQLGSELRAERDHQHIRVETLIAHPRRASRGVNPGHRVAHHADAETGKVVEGALSLLQCGLSNKRPGLAKPHHEMIALVDEDHLVFFVEHVPKPPRRSNPAKSTTQNQDSFHRCLLRAKGCRLLRPDRERPGLCSPIAGRPARSVPQRLAPPVPGTRSRSQYSTRVHTAH